MKVLKIIGIIILAIVLIGGIAVSVQPPRGNVEQSTVIKAPPATVFNEINNFKSFRLWSPWAKMDPEAKYVIEGPESGVGAKMSWEGKQVGRGSQWIEESVENEKVKNALSFEGYGGTAYATFIITPFNGASKLTWTYDGTNEGISGKAMWLFMGGMMNDWYIQGLMDLKNHIESLPAR